jgi:predicted RNA-binding Zn ribbon-like protein
MPVSRDPERGLAQFFGGRVCLDFANTIDWRLSAEPQELIPDYATLLRWSGMRHILPAASIVKLQTQSTRNSVAAAAVLQETRMLRDDICRAATTLCQGKELDLTVFNRRLADLPAQPRLLSADAGYVHDLPGKVLEEPLWPILWSVTALLTSQDAGRLGSCQAQDCGWFFVDESPNHSRLWCSSELCGNRERARRAYAKRRAGSAAES